MSVHQCEQYDLTKTRVKSRLKGLWRMTSGYHWHYIFANLSLGISALAKTSTYLLLSFFVDNYFPKTADTPAIPFIALGFVGLALIEGSFTFLSGRLASFTAENVTRRLRNFLFDHIQRLSFTYHDKTQTGDLIERCSSDVDALRRFFSDQAIGAGRIVLLFIVNFIALLNLNVKLALFSIIVIPFIVISSIIFFKKVTQAYEAYQEQEAVLSTTLQENLSGVRVVKAFARQAFEMGKFEKENWEKFLRGRKLLRMHSLFWPISDVICSAQVVAGMIIGATMAIHGDITAGTYLAYVGLVVWIIYPMRNLGRMIVQMSTGIVSFTRVQDIIKEDREPLDEGEINQVADLKGKLDFIKVGFSYDSEKSILKDISFTVNPGNSVALIGSTGSGKTTLVNLLPRFYESTSGQILLDGKPLAKYTRKYLRSQIGIVEQEPFLFSRSIRENITYGVGRKVNEQEIIEAARSAAIHDVITSLPKGYETLVGERGVTLSGGQKQRVAIARTILKNPRILILDDSTSAVDTETEAEIRLALENLMKARTTFIIAHRIQSIMNSDLILVMDEGKIIQSGSHSKLVKLPGMYRKIFEIQTRIEDELEKEIADATV